MNFVTLNKTEPETPVRFSRLNENKSTLCCIMRAGMGSIWLQQGWIRVEIGKQEGVMHILMRHESLWLHSSDFRGLLTIAR